MPCTYHETPQEIAANRQKQVDSLLAPYRKDLNRLTKENDFLRELVLAMAGGTELTSAQRKRVEEAQIHHRREDLDRLKELFKECGDWDGFEKVVKASVLEPLEPQLGFNPDDV